jgi:hypothetical protein
MQQPRQRRRTRISYSCEPCRLSKLRCDRRRPCTSCLRRNKGDNCHYSASPARHHGIFAASGNLTTENTLQHVTPAYTSSEAPGAEESGSAVDARHDHRPDDIDCSLQSRWDSILQRPVDTTPRVPHDPPHGLSSMGGFPFFPRMSSSLEQTIAALPTKPVCEYLITNYFQHISPFFHILHGPTFQKQYKAYLDDPSATDNAWLALLFLICSIAVNLFDVDDPTFIYLRSTLNTEWKVADVSLYYRQTAMNCLCQDEFLVRFNLGTLEALLLLVYSISHNEGVEQSWTLLGKNPPFPKINIRPDTETGITLNIAIALKCNRQDFPSETNCIEIERRRRCWSGVLLLHTYQAISFKDVDILPITNIETALPADVNDSDILADRILPASSKPTQMSSVRFKISLHQLSARICKAVSANETMSTTRLALFEGEIANEQRRWDSTFLLDGCPSLLETSSYAQWCLLQVYANQLYLILHRQFCRAGSNTPGASTQASRSRCIVAGAALLDIHRQLWESPRLRHIRWFMDGMTSFCAFHGAVALATCLLGWEAEVNQQQTYRSTFDAAVLRFQQLQQRSQVCKKAFPVLLQLQSVGASQLVSSSHLHLCRSMLAPSIFEWSNMEGPSFGASLNDWIDSLQWTDTNLIDWVSFWIKSDPSSPSNCM